MFPFNKTSRGLPQLVLVLTLAWALSAVLIFTGILINAREIDRRVVFINSVLTPINKHTGYIALAGKTNVIAAKIYAATPTLASGLSKTNDYVNSINRTAKTILKTAKEINVKVVPIGATVGTIHSTVLSINATVSSIHTAVVGSITPKLATTGRNVTGIGSSVSSILARARSILTTANAINVGVPAINRRVDTIQASVDGSGSQILPDFDKINALVGGAPTGTTINGHANSIDCAKLFNLGGPANLNLNNVLTNLLPTVVGAVVVQGGTDTGCGQQ